MDRSWCRCYGFGSARRPRRRTETVTPAPLNKRSRTMSCSARLVTMFAVAALPIEAAHAFTAEQAAEGQASYTQSCAACHGPELRNLPNAPLQGNEFIGKWRTRSTNDLLAQIRTTMPPESPGSLGEDAYLGIMSYILQRNGNAPSEQRLLAASGEPIAAGAGGGQPG